MLTGVASGTNESTVVNVNFQFNGLKGESIHDDTVWIVKTHSPWVTPYAPVFSCNKIICIIRNPVDVLLSSVNLYSLADHSSKTTFEYHERYP